MDNNKITEAIKQGRIFIYPTDTVYGLGCDAGNREAVEKIKEIKARDKIKPLSIIAPSIKWINDNLIADCKLEKYLPGAYTVILKKKNPDFLSHVSLNSTLGVRIPANKFTKIIQSSSLPFITTSVNLAGEKPAIDISEIRKEIKDKVDIIIEADEKLSGKPSTLIINGKVVERK